MDTRRILVLYRNSLFAQGIASLLQRVEGLEVTSLDLDQPQALQLLPSLQPQTVILDGDELAGWQTNLILQLLHLNPEAKVYCLSNRGKDIEVYDKHLLTIEHVGELLNTLREEA